MVQAVVKGDFRKTYEFLNRIIKLDFDRTLSKYGEEGVKALAEATPKRTGKTAASWSYKIEKSASGINIYWTNSNVNKGVRIAVILEYGHGTRKGGYVQGRHYISPAIQPIFDRIAEEAWKEVLKN